ncbi:MAG: flagellar biosynthesis protein FlhA [Clostridia bacterium]|nr:flagellar biosynthesis protein FlhA [Clostridia bacterium]
MATPNSLINSLRRVSSYSDVVFAVLALSIVLIIIIPMPPTMLDVLLTFSLTVSILIFLTTLFITEPLQLSVFPSLLLVVTLLRLALNVASTRLILSNAQAGQVIQAFGSFVIAGNYVVGLIIFVIITVIQFVVITNGAGRVAEVAARFTLDAMPGKQMSIDADLNGGLIDEEEARRRRRQLQQEAEFFGAMDGASKFIRGDAIAGLIITLINIVGGLIIGMWQKGMPISDALQTYTVLTAGDGLVTQIPALLVSTGTGILITKASGNESLGKTVSSQLTSFPRVFILAAVVLALLGLAPGLPDLPFLFLASICGVAAYALRGHHREQEMVVQELKKQRRQPEDVLPLFQIDPLEIEIGYNLVPLTDESQGGDLLDRLAAVRRQCATELGIYVRPIRIRDNLRLDPNAYVFRIHGVEIEKGELMPTHYLAMGSGKEDEVQGIPTREPAFGLPAWWVAPAEKEALEIRGFTVVDPNTVLITHLTEFIKQHAHELLGRQETKELIDMVKSTNPAVVEELFPDLLTVGEVQKVLQNLLRERIPIRDLVGILESLADNSRISKDTDFLTEGARQAIKRSICQKYASEDGKLRVISLHPRLEQEIADSIQNLPQGSYPAVEPNLAQRVLEKLSNLVQEMVTKGYPPVVLCSSRIRLPFRRLIERFLPNLAVLSMSELVPSVQVEVIGTVNGE